MCSIIQKIKDKIFSPKRIKLFLLGVWCSGKTTILYRLKLGQIVNTIPTIGFNIEEIQYKDVLFQITEAGGGDRLYPLFVHYVKNADGMMVIVDSSHLDYQELLQTTFRSCLNEIYTNKKIPILIIANKSDKCQSTNDQILKYVGVDQVQDKIFHHIIHTNCFSGEGIDEVLSWLYHTYQN